MLLPMVPVPVDIPNVPFYSQFHDIQSTTWQKQGCGITSLAMVIDYYKPNAVSVNALLTKAVAFGAYDPNAGWIHKDLVLLAGKYGLSGNTYDLSAQTSSTAFTHFQSYVKTGPVIASVHYKFDPASTIPHMVVVDGIENGTVFYNDPAAKSGEKQISTTDFVKAWKKKFIVIRPTHPTSETALTQNTKVVS